MVSENSSVVAPQPATRSVLPRAAETSAVWLLASAVVVAPLFLACSPEWPRLGLEAVMGLAACLWAVSRPRSPILMAIPVVVCLIFCIQVVPLPDSILFAIAPISGGAWKAETAFPAGAWGSISIDPAATLMAIRRLFLGLATAVTVTSLARSKSHRTVLIWSLGVTGIVLVAGGLLFGPAKDAKLLWGTVDLSGIFRKTYSASASSVMSAGFGLREVIQVGQRQYVSISPNVGNGFFSFPYCNLFGGALTATLPVAIGLWLTGTQGRLPVWLQWGVAGLAAAAATWMITIVVGSRGGGLAIALSWVSLTVIVTRESWRNLARIIAFGRIAIAVISISVLALVLFWLGFSLAIPEHWRETFDAELRSGRLNAAILAFRMYYASPIMGTGLDTYQLLMPRYATERFIIFFAHNEYAQLLAEAGVIGIVFLGLTVSAVGLRFRRFWTDAKGSYRITNAGVWASCVGLAAHSAVDWNFHLPANALLGSVLVGLVVSSVPEPREAWRDANRWTTARFATSLVLIIGCVSVAGLLTRDAEAEHHRRQVMRAVAMDWANTRWGKPGRAEQALRTTLPGAVSIAAWDPINAQLALAICKGHLHLAVQPGAESERHDLLVAADDWLNRARQHCPALPEVTHPTGP